MNNNFGTKGEPDGSTCQTPAENAENTFNTLSEIIWTMIQPL